MAHTESCSWAVQVLCEVGLELDVHDVFWQTLCPATHAVSQAAWGLAYICRHTGQTPGCLRFASSSVHYRVGSTATVYVHDGPDFMTFIVQHEN